MAAVDLGGRRPARHCDKGISASADSLLLEGLAGDDRRAAARPTSVSSGIGSLATSSGASSRSGSPLGPASPTLVYRGRDVLDLSANLFDSRWRLQPTVLPSMNLRMYWENRSQYHRLSEPGTRELLRQSAAFRIVPSGRQFPTGSILKP
ncbi:uncharacterized protein LOC134534962 isoform X2 [Bacillus rossius redtenbacheri]|uniref:uncharacterized protein LOC134534962 isoform X2 n=1 Tax=Bacillus rossius redtenbacheri TaxID=93214 RepID=UPI002FDEB310